MRKEIKIKIIKFQGIKLLETNGGENYRKIKPKENQKRKTHGRKTLKRGSFIPNAKIKILRLLGFSL